MEYSKIVSVTGLPGLYELINSKSDGAIVRSLEDKTTRFASGRIHNFSHLESIEVYTQRENVNLAEIFQAMEKMGESLPDTRDNGLLKKYFEKVYPEIDFERVYNSDLKKMIKWYEVLKKNNIEIKVSEPEPETNMEEETKPPEEETKKKETQKKVKSEADEKTNKEKAKQKSGNKSAAAKSEKPSKKAAKKKEK